MKEYICKEDIRNKLYDEDVITMRGVNIINNYPAADVREIKHGEWESFLKTGVFCDYEYARCPFCKATFYLDDDGNAFSQFKKDNLFCRKCGADMMGETDIKCTFPKYNGGLVPCCTHECKGCYWVEEDDKEEQT